MSELQLHITTGNRMEILAEGLAELLRTQAEGLAADPLRPQWVVVQSKGMQRWLSMTVARLNGICANVAFPFPNAILETLYARIIGPLQEFNPYDQGALTFRILQLLPVLLDCSEFEPLRRYLAGAKRPLKNYQLAGKIADMLDQYAVFRPEMLLDWERIPTTAKLPPGFEWQAVLWREIVKGTEFPNRSHIQKQLIRKLTDPNYTIAKEVLPPWLAVFGISHLPPYHIEALEALSYRIPVYLFLLNPCRHFWFDILSDHEKIRLRKPLRPSSSVEDLYLERGNRLLASLGHLGKHFFDRVYQSDAQIDDRFVDNQTETLLGTIQQDILDLVDRPQPQEETPTPITVQADGTLRIQSCHSPMREVEVLYDQLIDMFETCEGLQPRDILVMTPDITLYTPFVHAVFGSTDGSIALIPYSVADQNILRENKVAESFVALLDLVSGRFEASRIVTLLECPAVCRRFGLSESDLVRIERWVRTAGIRWGWDAAARKQHKLPGFNENSWRLGLDRLILGYALAGQDDQLFSGILPYEGIGAGEGPIIGRFVAFAEAVHDILVDLHGTDTLDGWCRRLQHLIARMYQSDDHSEHQIESLRDMIAQLQRFGSAVKGAFTVDFDVVRQHLKDSLSGAAYESGFMSGGITFCAMLPMRSIPAKVICLLGMNHDAYPREQHEPGFNLIAVEPRSGDRSKRNDDRYLFLEALLSARDIFYLSYVGQNNQDNSRIPPSVLIDEIIEYVTEGLSIPADRFVTHHPLHSFSPAYFNKNDPLLFSYSRQNKEAAGQLADEGIENQLFTSALTPPDDQWRTCEWSQLAAFFTHPARFLLENRLGVYLQDALPTMEDRENFGLDALESYLVGQDILHRFLKGNTAEHIHAALNAAGVLPHGTVGKVVYQQLGREVQDYISTMADLLPTEKPRREDVAITLSPFSLLGAIDGIHGNTRFDYRMAKARPADLLKLFIFHLALLASSLNPLPKNSILVCKEAVWSFGEVDDTHDILRTLLNAYWQGLHKPLALIGKTSFEYAYQRIIKENPRTTALRAAAAKWHGNDFSPGESADPYYRRCFGETDPLTPEFEDIAMQVYGPLFAAGQSTAALDLNSR
ncbi:MAG: hypothetical protein VR64_24825 [Desulfatitalea sp. BRH_c12]|nr:MAG: hypothetical protein VR64_24825 [Desulfatitalea sp. BRH_c12]